MRMRKPNPDISAPEDLRPQNRIRTSGAYLFEKQVDSGFLKPEDRRVRLRGVIWEKPQKNIWASMMAGVVSQSPQALEAL